MIIKLKKIFYLINGVTLKKYLTSGVPDNIETTALDRIYIGNNKSLNRNKKSDPERK